MTLPVDTLDQIGTILRSDRAQAARLRTLLLELADLPEYKHWLEEAQFLGRRFRLPRDFISGSARERRLLESMRLVVDDILDVKINTSPEGLVFITDGLFVPGEFRVFPWRDESDRIIERIESLRWSSWATVVVDPSIGCGHNALRMDVSHRLGLDVSIRALGFANVNSALNTRPFDALAIFDVSNGIPLLAAGDAARILFLVNMPFALEPVSNSLVRTAAGGENGYEKTFAALRALKDYARRVQAGAAVRAVVLTYSVGNHAEDKWVVHEEACRLFGSTAVSWEILRDQKLWRINGKKEQPNPMPLSSLKFKAECQYYVRDPRMREPLRVGYVAKERELRQRGYDSLAYGVLGISVSIGAGK
jgi:hypothetical protein